VVAAGCVQEREARDQQDEDQALEQVGDEFGQHLGVEQQVARLLDQGVDAAALGVGDAEHVRLLGQADRLVDAARVLHLGFGQSACAAHADRFEGSQREEHEHARDQDARGGLDVEQERGDDER
jgi:hypothetical protein